MNSVKLPQASANDRRCGSTQDSGGDNPGIAVFVERVGKLGRDYREVSFECRVLGVGCVVCVRG